MVCVLEIDLSIKSVFCSVEVSRETLWAVPMAGIRFFGGVTRLRGILVLFGRLRPPDDFRDDALVQSGDYLDNAGVPIAADDPWPAEVGHGLLHREPR